MPDSHSLPEELAESLLRRLEVLETRCNHLEGALADLRGESPSGPGTGVAASNWLAQFDAVGEFRRREQLGRFRAAPAALAAVREDLANLNRYLAERGLPPRPDRYPELPNA